MKDQQSQLYKIGRYLILSLFALFLFSIIKYKYLYPKSNQIIKQICSDQQMLEKVFSYFKESGYDQNSLVKQWQINKVFDQILKKIDSSKQFNRNITSQIFLSTQKQQSDKVNLYDFLINMQTKNKLRYLMPQSDIYLTQDKSQQEEFEVQSLESSEKDKSTNSNKERSNILFAGSQVQPKVQIEQYSQRESVQSRNNNNQNGQSISRALNATINDSVAPGSSVVTDSFIVQKTPGNQRQNITPKPSDIASINSQNQNNINSSVQPFLSMLPQRTSQLPNRSIILGGNPSLITIQDNNQIRQPLLRDQRTQQQIQDQIYRSLHSSRPPIKNKESLVRPPSVSQNDRQSVLSKRQSKNVGQQDKGKKCLQKIWYIPMCIFIFGAIIFACSFIIHSLLVSKAIDQVILRPQNQGIWAHYPGDTKTRIMRNWTFFNITNADEMMFYNQKPKFRQITGYKIQQLQDYLNITYLEDGDRVKMVDWLHFINVPESRNLQQKVKVLNVGGLAYWYNLKISRPTILLQQGLGLLFNTLEETIIENVYAQGIHVQFLSSFDNAMDQLFSPAGINVNQSKFIFEDPAYGLGQQNNLKYWIQAVRTPSDIDQEVNNPGYIFLLNYFTLQKTQLQIILQKFRIYIDFLTQSVLKNNYCPDVRQCTGRYLAYRQFTNSYVTNNPPKSQPPINQTITICQSNTTCQGFFPQLQAFYHRVYLVRNPQKNNSLTFDPEWMKNIVNYNVSIQQGKDYNTAQNSLFHIGNLDALWDNGTQYDNSIKANIKNNQDQKGEEAFSSSSNDNNNPIPNLYLENIKTRFGLPTLQHAMVFWEWAKYLTHELILRNQTNQKLGVGNLFAGGLYQAFSYLQDHLQDYLLTELIYIDMQDVQKVGDCSTFIYKTFDFKVNQNQTAMKICDNYGQKLSRPLIKDLLSICKNVSGSTQQHFKTKYNIPLSKNFDAVCDPYQTDSTFGQLLYQRRVHLNEIYNCTITPKQYCSDYQIAAMQWSQSKVTLNPPEQLNIQANTHYTFKQWDSNSKRFQYGFYKSKYPKQQSFPQISVRDAYSLLNFDNWFSASVSLKQFVDESVDQHFKRYMRYVALEVGLNGLTMERTPNQLIFGYEDQILNQVKNSYIPFGGDPSTPSLIAFNDPNITEKEATMTLQWSTGLKNSSLLSQYRKINDLNYLTIEKDFFNGNVTQTKLISPWQGQDYMYGTSAKMFAPNQFDQPNISLYVPNIQRYGSGTLNGEQQQRFGFDVQVAYLGDSIYQSTQQSDLNKKYYQSFRAIFNQTSVVGFPLFVCKNHFMNVSSNWSQLVEIYNQDQSIKYQQTSHWDDSFVVVEPYTGVSFQSTIYLQSNYYHTHDSLLTFYNESMLPIFSLWRSGNLTEDVANDLLGPLGMGLAAVKWSKIIGIIIVGIACVIAAVIYYKKRLAKKNNMKMQDQDQKSKARKIPTTKASQLGVSMQPMSRQNQQMVRQQRRQSSSDYYIPPPVTQQQV